jgi:hypothetical protein
MSSQHSQDTSDAYLRWRFKKTYAPFEPPREGKSRLMKLAYEKDIQSERQDSRMNSRIEQGNYRDDNIYLAWLLASQLQVSFLSTVKLQ